MQNLAPGVSTEVIVNGTGTFPPGEEIPEWADADDPYGYSWVFEVKTPGDFSTAGVDSWLAERQFEATAAQYTRSIARFRAFIPTKYIDGGTGCTYLPPKYHFNGNNRGYSLAESASYKTNSQGSYAWESKTFTPYVNTGTTIVFNESNTEVTRKKATTTKMSSRLLSRATPMSGCDLFKTPVTPSALLVQ
ncbi:hypothetical protein [Ornithinimicrobium flavum]|uniref:hypothetical protein n=1 Tax=Ornithinimicrobium flavum TaxID=1288636 RepID=UPI0010705890|nr:hypothetical protein [Ornithinimicrobium flavum]